MLFERREGWRQGGIVVEVRKKVGVEMVVLGRFRDLCWVDCISEVFDRLLRRKKEMLGLHWGLHGPYEYCWWV